MKKLIIAGLCVLLMGCFARTPTPPGEDGPYDMTPDHDGEDYEGVEYGRLYNVDGG